MPVFFTTIHIYIFLILYPHTKIQMVIIQLIGGWYHLHLTTAVQEPVLWTSVVTSG